MKVLHIGKYYPPYFGGIEKVNYDLVEGLNEQNVETDVLVFNHLINIKKEDKKYKIYRARTLFTFASQPISFDFFRIFKKIYKKYDVLHFHLPNPLATVTILLFNPKTKIVLHWHSDIVKQKILLIFYDKFQRWLLNRADKIVTTSPNYIEGSKILQEYKHKTIFVPIGINENEFQIDNTVYENLKNKYNGKKIVFSLGRLIYYKGFEYLVDSAKYINNDVIILIGGSGTLKNKLQQQIIENKLQNKVKLIGNIPFNELGSYYKICNLFCLPSIEKSEAFGVVQIEAMAFKKPIISANICGSGVPWVNINNHTGKVVNIKDSHAIAEAINQILSNDNDYDRYSNNSKIRFTKLFTKNNMVNEFINVYEGLSK